MCCPFDQIKDQICQSTLALSLIYDNVCTIMTMLLLMDNHIPLKQAINILFNDSTIFFLQFCLFLLSPLYLVHDRYPNSKTHPNSNFVDYCSLKMPFILFLWGLSCLCVHMNKSTSKPKHESWTFLSSPKMKSQLSLK